MMKKMIAILTMAAIAACLCCAAFAENEIASNVLHLTLAQQKEEKQAVEEKKKVQEDAPVTITIDEATDMRLEGDGMSEILATLAEGTEITVLGQGENANWLMVEVNGETGYIYVEDNPSQEAQEEDAVPEVVVFTSCRSDSVFGETIHLTSRVYHCEGYDLLYVWQCDKGDGFEDVEGADGETFDYVLDEVTNTYWWRLLLLYKVAE